MAVSVVGLGAFPEVTSMRLLLVLVVATLVLPGCKREAQEAVAQAKGAAADAERAAKEAAAQARGATDQATAEAKEAAAQARSAADQAAAQAKAAAGQAAATAQAAADQARKTAAGASESARQGLDATGQTLRELTAGDQVLGVLVGIGATELSVRPSSGPVQNIGTDARTRWILKGAAGGKEGLLAGATVRVTYIVRDGRRVATQVEAR